MNFHPAPKPEKQPAKLVRFTDSRYLGYVKQLPCVLAYHHGLHASQAIDAHHCFHGRYSQGKVSDHMVIPLAKCRHQGLMSACNCIAIHKQKKAWREAFGNDYDYIAWTLDEVERRFDYRPNFEQWAKINNVDPWHGMPVEI